MTRLVAMVVVAAAMAMVVEDAEGLPIKPEPRKFVYQPGSPSVRLYPVHFDHYLNSSTGHFPMLKDGSAVLQGFRPNLLQAKVGKTEKPSEMTGPTNAPVTTPVMPEKETQPMITTVPTTTSPITTSVPMRESTSSLTTSEPRKEFTSPMTTSEPKRESSPETSSEPMRESTLPVTTSVPLRESTSPLTTSKPKREPTTTMRPMTTMEALTTINPIAEVEAEEESVQPHTERPNHDMDDIEQVTEVRMMLMEDPMTLSGNDEEGPSGATEIIPVMEDEMQTFTELPDEAIQDEKEMADEITMTETIPGNEVATEFPSLLDIQVI